MDTSWLKRGNLFEDAELPVGASSGERVELLASSAGVSGVRVERIVSRGEASPPGFWYDQGTVEWVTLLTGRATLRFEGEDAPVALRPGDWVEIPAHCRHRVESTAPDEETVWLAVHWDPEGS